MCIQTVGAAASRASGPSPSASRHRAHALVLDTGRVVSEAEFNVDDMSEYVKFDAAELEKLQASFRANCDAAGELNKIPFKRLLECANAHKRTHFH